MNNFNTLRSHMTDISFGKSTTGEGVTLGGVHKADLVAADFIFL